ncbi:MAG: hypothetical protein JWO31_3988 [Phycisphaerales bacterium]|nr:hypothetical protein [Phycisphaerales bacterium]
MFVAAAAGCTGCGSADEIPRDRLGALPFPGLLTLYSAGDPAHLGPHRYEHRPRLFGPDESERGIIYTVRAGFLDLAHVRIAIDWTRYCTRAVHQAIRSRQPAVTLPGPEGDTFHVTLNYPDAYAASDADDPGAALDPVACRIGQRAAYLMLTWHEIATWFGYRTVFFIDESPSAFTYDDSVSHLVGMRVAERAMGDADRGFDEAVTVALDAELRALGAVGPEQTDQAARAVEGVWWADGRPLKRQADVCPGEDEVVHPWLVPGLPFAAGDPSPEPFPLPHLDGPPGLYAAVTASIAVEPVIPEAQAMRELIPGRPNWFREEHDLTALVSAMRSQMRAQYGPYVNNP